MIQGRVPYSSATPLCRRLLAITRSMLAKTPAIRTLNQLLARLFELAAAMPSRADATLLEFISRERR